MIELAGVFNHLSRQGFGQGDAEHAR